MGRRQNAFTLVEVLIVIGILTLLVTLAAPSLGRARELARRTACQSNLHGVAVGLRMYLNNSNDVMPVACQLPSAHLTEDPRIADVLAPDLPAAEILRCPSDTVRNYFLTEGSSYEYQTILGGRKVTDAFLTNRLGESNTPVMNDYEAFHGLAGQSGSMNFLFADCHVGDFE